MNTANINHAHCVQQVYHNLNLVINANRRGIMHRCGTCFVTVRAANVILDPEEAEPTKLTYVKFEHTLIDVPLHRPHQGVPRIVLL